MKTLTEAAMKKCHVCGATEFRSDLVNEVLDLDGHHVLVEGIPAQVCVRCGETIFSRETTEKIRRMVRGEAKPTKSVPMDVFAFESR
ncbi:MAG: YgiT-type zinc finger protein [Planctomycetota bacterium]